VGDGVNHDATVEAEQAVLACLLLHPERVDDVTPILDGSEFRTTGHAALFRAMADQVTERGTFDLATIRPIDPELVDSLWTTGTPPSPSLLLRHAEQVAQQHANRRTAHLLAEAQQAIANGGADGDVMDNLTAAYERIRFVGDVADDLDYETWARPPDDPDAIAAGWLIPGVLRRQSRLMLVAPEGIGKSTLTRQFAALCAAGIHPLLTSRRMRPLKVLVIDLENDPQTAVDVRGLVDAASPHGLMLTLQRQAPDWDRSNLRVVSRPDGINVRTRSDRRRLEAVIARVRPDLVTFGPIYKSYVKDDRESDEALSADLQRIFDRLRIRYDCAWIFEHHAPKAAGPKSPRADPFGSSLWKRWPDLGVRLDEASSGDPTVLKLGRFRYDRYPVPGLPDEIHRGGQWPWHGKWNDGTPDLDQYVIPGGDL
jgi:hypothetical protein